MYILYSHFTINLGTNYYINISSGSIVLNMKLKARIHIYMASMMVFCTLQDNITSTKLASFRRSFIFIFRTHMK
jgi:hypothetical protein